MDKKHKKELKRKKKRKQIKMMKNDIYQKTKEVMLSDDPTYTKQDIKLNAKRVYKLATKPKKEDAVSQEQVDEALEEIKQRTQE